MKPLRRRRGFTLIELLVAITVMAIVAVLGWRGLDSIIRARVSLNDELTSTRGLQLAFAQMQSDCSNIALSADIGNRPTLAAQPGRLALVRMTYAENQPSRIQVVSYRVENGSLVRRESVPTRDLRALDAAWTTAISDRDATEPVALSGNVGGMAVRNWNPNGGWQTSNGIISNAQQTAIPGAGPAAAAAANAAAQAAQGPTGIEVSLQLQGQPASLIKVFLLGAA
ncbi:PulJ/GspJ family protein [Noviherbaspirillum aridicola]|uniref:General secretion pathway protein GspJ n=1 Tax=Noviherbaspirillum aridicola TaxID=2849687 RepID=A0ABQ4Q0T1_9BURK|nr:prepilin-type N-terminal cleavage/methylation domain-containing protein [Noviherbaspirillum aridicola]GIZ50776.1 general secretion pathway protein GspJ [Noviherbaspirillum aridicola]